VIGRVAVRRLARHADLLQELAVVRELQDVGVRSLAGGGVATAVAADPDIALVIDGDAVVRRRPHIGLVGRRAAPSGDDVASRVELDHRRRRHAAFAERRVGHRADLLLRVERVVPVDDEHMVTVVDADADHVAEHPVVGERLGPEWVDFERRRIYEAILLPRPGVRAGRIPGRRSTRRASMQ